MTPEEQRIALCEWLGWKVWEYGNEPFPFAAGHTVQRWTTREGALSHDLPDTNSLDVLHEIVLKLREQDGKKYLRYQQRLVEMDGLFYPDATAAQRREALCRVLFPERFK